MATWTEVEGFIRNNYKLEKDEGDFFQMLFELDNDRSQIVFVQKFTTGGSGNVWIQISSPVGVIKQSDLNKALEVLNDKVCGGLVKIGEKHFVRHCLPIEDLSSAEFDTPLRIVISVADDLEKQFVGGDEH
jgi:hypothetical protein